jgi:hypothetical protein
MPIVMKTENSYSDPILRQKPFEVVDRENTSWYVSCLFLEATMGVLEDIPLGDTNIRYIFSRN